MNASADAASSGPEKAREMELASTEKKPAAAPAAAADDDAGAAMDMEQFVQSGMLDASDNVRIHAFTRSLVSKFE